MKRNENKIKLISKNSDLPNGTFHISDDGTIGIVQKFNTDLSHISGTASASKHFDNFG